MIAAAGGNGLAAGRIIRRALPRRIGAIISFETLISAVAGARIYRARRRRGLIIAAGRAAIAITALIFAGRAIAAFAGLRIFTSANRAANRAASHLVFGAI